MEAKRNLPKEMISCNGEFDMIQPPLIGEWNGRIFLHPMTDKKKTDEFVEKFSQHGNGILLIGAGTDSHTFQKHILNRAHALFFIQGRFYYLKEDGSKEKENCGKAMVFVAYGQQNSIALKHCKLKGVYVPLIRRYTKKIIDTLTEKIEL